ESRLPVARSKVHHNSAVLGQPRQQRTNLASNHATTPARAFSTTPSRSATHAIYNPQRDEDGKEMMLEITPRAAKVSFTTARPPARPQRSSPLPFSFSYLTL